MKILNLVIHRSDAEIYHKMYHELSYFYQLKYGFVKTFFIEYSPDLSTEWVINGDRLIIKGTESLVPGLLFKTIDSILIAEGIYGEFDYLIRSNVSTVVNFNNLKIIIKKNNIDYLGGLVLRLGWLDPEAGVVDDRWFGTYFATGTLIVLSNKFVKNLLQNRHKLHYDLIDDVSIGVFFRQYYPTTEIHQIPKERYKMIGNQIFNYEDLKFIEQDLSPIAWRNKSIDRKIDLINISNIVKVLL